MTTLSEKVLDLLQTDQLLHQALQRVLALRLRSLLPLLERLRQASTSRLSSRRQHRARWTRLFGQQLSLKLLRLIVCHRHQLRGFHPHGGRGGGRSRGVAQLHVLFRMMAREAGLMMTGQRVYANVR